MARPPFVVGIVDLRRRPGSRREVAVRGELDGLEVSTAEVPAQAEVDLDGVLESIEGGSFRLVATVRAPWQGECRRCLEPVRGVLEVAVDEVFEPRPTPGETYPVEGDELDLAPAVRDAIVLDLPLAPLCREGCAGPAPAEFPTGAGGPGDPEPAGPPGGPDPRWAALRELRLDD